MWNFKPETSGRPPTMRANMIITLNKLSAWMVGLWVMGSALGLLRAEAAPAPSEQMPRANTNDADVLITHLDISVRADFQSNRVPTIVQATLENPSPKAVDKVAFLLCVTANDRHFQADIIRIKGFDENSEKDLSYTIREVPHPEIQERQAPIVEVALPKPVRAGGQFWLQFEYTMTGKPDYGSAPIERSENGIKEVYLRGSDYRWCPSVYRDHKSYTSRDRLTPSWTLTMESPKGYVAVTDGELVRRWETGGWMKAVWKSLLPGMPHLYVGPYKAVSRTVDGLTIEMYAPDEPRLQEAAPNLEKYARIFNLYSELYGDLGVRTYRIVCSGVAGVGVGNMASQTIDLSMVNDTHHIAHEMAHAWWGRSVSTRGPGWKFLSEAMAEFSARWILRCAFGDADYGESLTDASIQGLKQRHFCKFFPVTEPMPKFPVPLMVQEGYDPLRVARWNYDLGPLVVNHVREVLDNDLFFQCLRIFQSQYGGKQAGIEEFLQTLQSVSGMDMTAELRGLLWTTGFASYRRAGFTSQQADGGYRTTVRIQNEGDYGLTCPLLLKTIGGDKRTVFKVDGKQEKEFVFATAYRVIEAVVDPDMTALQYHPEQKLRLWQAMLRTMEGYANNEAYGKSYIYYALGEFEKAPGPISDYLREKMIEEKVQSLDELLKQGGHFAPYVFMRGVFHLALDDYQHAQEDVRSAFPCMLRAMAHDDGVRAPDAYYEVGAIAHTDLGEYLALLGLIGGREFSFGGSVDETAKKRKVEEWQQWWETVGKNQKADLSPLKAKCEAQRQAFCQRELALSQAAKK